MKFRLGEVQAPVDFHCDKMEYSENQSRRNNIRIESKAEVALESKLNLPSKVEIERAHRTGKS